MPPATWARVGEARLAPAITRQPDAVPGGNNAFSPLQRPVAGDAPHGIAVCAEAWPAPPSKDLLEEGDKMAPALCCENLVLAPKPGFSTLRAARVYHTRRINPTTTKMMRTVSTKPR
jgi:hypothetical protein